MERKERKLEREGEAWERERGRKGSRRSDGRNSSDQEVKSVYLIRAKAPRDRDSSYFGLFPP